MKDGERKDRTVSVQFGDAEWAELEGLAGRLGYIPGRDAWKSPSPRNRLTPPTEQTHGP